MAGNQGLGSDNMDDKTKDRIHSMGGKASHTGGNTSGGSSKSGITSNKSGGGAIDKDAQKRGGQNSHK